MAESKPGKSVTASRARRRKTGFAFALLILFALALQFAQARTVPFASSRTLKVWVFDVGQGDAIFIQAPDGEKMLVGGGPDDEVLAKLGSVMAPWDRTIDAAVLTDANPAQSTGLVDVLARYRVGTLVETGVKTYAAVSKALESAANASGTTRTFVHAGSRLMLGDVRLDILAPVADVHGQDPEEPNDTAIVIRLTYGDSSILLTGDASANEEPEILNDLDAPIDVLKVAHQGSGSSTTMDFLRAVQPRVAIISVGKDNTYNQPSASLLARLSLAGAFIRRTDLDGDILITSDGGEPTVTPSPLPF